jgi:predicted nucleic acid-binding Zn ribbon protein
MRRRYASAKPQRLSDILQRALKKHHIPLSIDDLRLREAWLQAVGPRIAAQSQPDAIKRTVLFVKVANSTWMQQLHFLKREILDKFNHVRQREPVKDIFFAIGKMTTPVAERQEKFFLAGQAPVLKTRDKKMIEKSLAVIADKELQDILKRVMTKEITRRRMIEMQRDR